MDRKCPKCESPMIIAKCGCGWLDREALRRTGPPTNTKPKPIVKNSLDRLVAECKRSPEIVEFLQKIKSAPPEHKAAMRKKMLSKISSKIAR